MIDLLIYISFMAIGAVLGIIGLLYALSAAKKSNATHDYFSSTKGTK